MGIFWQKDVSNTLKRTSTPLGDTTPISKQNNLPLSSTCHSSYNYVRKLAKQYFGKEPDLLIVPYTLEQVNSLLQTSDALAISCLAYPGQIDNHYPDDSLIQFAWHRLIIFPKPSTDLTHHIFRWLLLRHSSPSYWQKRTHIPNTLFLGPTSWIIRRQTGFPLAKQYPLQFIHRQCLYCQIHPFPWNRTVY